VLKSLRYLSHVSASAADGLLETLVPRRKSPAEMFCALADMSVGDFESPLPYWTIIEICPNQISERQDHSRDRD
jgi:hypothetical protein